MQAEFSRLSKAQRIKFFLASMLAVMFAGADSQTIKYSVDTTFSNGAGGKTGLGGGKKTLGEIVLFVLILFIVFLFATSGIIANSNIQTQLKNGAYYGGLFASIVVILIVLGFIL